MQLIVETPTVAGAALFSQTAAVSWQGLLFIKVVWFNMNRDKELPGQ